MKKILTALLAAALLLSCAGCGGEGAAPAAAPDFSHVDFDASSYKHINNGGLAGDEKLPYNVDAISGATLTVEGPAVVTSIPLSVRELENRSTGLHRGMYSDSTGAKIYEGMDLYFLLHHMVEGDNGIRLTDSAYKVVVKDSNRATVAEFTLAEVTAAHDAGTPILLAYGVGSADGTQTAPFVFDAPAGTDRSPGYVAALDNGDGCLRLVYDAASYGSGGGDTFTNAAYVYVCEAAEPGFKHTACAADSFGAPRYTDYIVTFRGSALGCEIDLSTAALEALVTYDAAGEVTPGGMAYRNQYSLANNAYWYVNEYEGLELYGLLQYLGMDSAEDMGPKLARTTLVRFTASDGVPANETFSVDALSYPDAFGFYNKNAADQNDGSYVPVTSDLVATGYPVLMAYGVNRYPYTIAKTDPDYVSGLSNAGGPFRIVFGKTQYGHANGSNQVQRLQTVIAGEDVLYNTHAFTDDPAHRALADSALRCVVHGTDGGVLLDRSFTAGELETLLYGPEADAKLRRDALVKGGYTLSDTGERAVYEGLDLEYLLMELLGLPGTNGSVRCSNGREDIRMDLEELLQGGAVLAFAKNGAPLVADAAAPGYVKERALHPLLDSDPAVYPVDNAGGPLALLLPGQGDGARADLLSAVSEITVDLVPDAYAHLAAPYAADAGDSIRFFGEGLEREAAYTVADIESRQTRVKTVDFGVPGETGPAARRRFRGIGLYTLFAEIGIKNNAGDVIIHSGDGSTVTVPLSRLKKSYPDLTDETKPAVSALLAYGAGDPAGDARTGLPLVAGTGEGYDAGLDNSGGPLKLILPPTAAADGLPFSVDRVVAVEVTANDVDTWSHAMSDIYAEFLECGFTLTVKNDDSEWSRDFTVGELEALKELVVREPYTVLDIGVCEGLDLWKLVRRFAGDIPGIDAPVAVTAYADDGYKNDLLSVFYLDGLVNGVENEGGERRKLLLCYAVNGCPLVDDESHEGYTGLAGNTAGPLRIVAETNQGASVKRCVKLVVTVPGSGPICGAN